MPLIVQRASAGSGKTEQLARRYLQILLAPSRTGHAVDPTTILAATFTREAAGEMLARIFKILAKGCREQEARKSMVQGTLLSLPTQEQCERLLRLLVERIDRLAVGTIDALFARQAQTLALDLGIAPCWRIAESSASDTLAKEAVLQLLEEDPYFSKEWSKLHHFTRTISFLEEAALVLEKNRFFVKSTCAPLTERIPEKTGPLLVSKKLAEETLHFLKNFSLPLTAQGKPNERWKSALQKLEENFSQPLFLKDLWGLGTLIASCMNEEARFYGKPIPSEFVAHFAPLAEASSEEQKRLALVREEALRRLLGLYQQARYKISFQAGAYTFGEIEEVVTRSADDFSSNELAIRLESSIEHLLLDEYQDTSQRQHDFLSPVISDVLAKGGTSFVVGDIKQGIYGWRGGKRHLLRSLEEEYAGHVVESPSLHQSYRSSPAVLDAVNEVFSSLKKEEALELMEGCAAFKKAAARWNLDFEPQQGAPSVKNLAGRVHLHEIQHVSEEPQRDVLEKVVSLVEAHRSQDPKREIAILVRRTKFIPQLLLELRSRGILASGEGGNPLADTLAVEVMLSFLLWIDHPGHTAAQEHIASSPLAEMLCEPPASLRKKLMTQGLAKMLRTWAASPLFYEACSSYERARLEQLIALAHRFEATGKGTLSDFVEKVRRERVESALSQGVRVLSIHASKGLEFETVLLMDLDTNIFAGAHEGLRVHRHDEGDFFIQTSSELMALQGRKNELEALHEEQWAEALSLLYVGMTRAISYLDLVILPASNSSKKSMAQWLRASGLRSHEAFGISWHDKKRVSLQEPVIPTSSRTPSNFTSSAPLSKLFKRSPSQETEQGWIRLAEKFYDSGARIQGSLQHALLAEVLWLDHDLPSSPDLEKLLEEKELRKFFEKKYYLEQWNGLGVTLLEVWRERPFAVVLHQENRKELLTGTFDRVILGYPSQGAPATSAEIIDFKTTPHSETKKEEREKQYQGQLEAYQSALQKMLPYLESITARIIWI